MIEKNRIYVQIDYYNKDKIKTISGARWHSSRKKWSIPVQYREDLYAIFPEFKGQIEKEYNGIEYQNQVINNVIKKVYHERKEFLKQYEFKLKPFLHQIDGCALCLAHRKFALFWEMGTGKTKVICDTSHILFNENVIQYCLVICPKSIMENWRNEIIKNCGDTDITILEGTKKKRIELLRNCGKYGIVNYDGIQTLENEDFSRFDMVVLDESSRIKNHNAKRTKLIHKLFNNARYKYILTGTPITQSPIDIYSQFKFLDDNYLGFSSFYSFRGHYCIMGGYGGYQVIGYKYLDSLRDNIDKHSSQKKKEECVDLPGKTYVKRRLIMTPDLKKQYISMYNNLILELDEQEALTASLVITKMTRLRQILSGVFLPSSPKVDEVINILEETDKKVIIWCCFIESMNMLKNELDKKGYKSVLFNGATKNRQETIDTFQTGLPQVFIAQINTGGVGINLTASSLSIYYENTFSLEDRIQSEARNDRIGQTNKVTYIDLYYMDTIEEMIYNAISAKQDIAKYLIKSFEGGKYV